ncbi:MAG: hypothetical protein DI601_20490 [Azospirillum brasilense]|nr:MAG: hypothetical protein DI601_20490 [Azospirillum brasilense]
MADGFTMSDVPPRTNSAGKSGRTRGGKVLAKEIERLTTLDRASYATERRAVAKKHQVPVAELDALRAESLRRRRGGASAPAETNDGSPIDPRGRSDLYIDTADLPDTARDLAGKLAGIPVLFERGAPARLAYDAQRGGLVAEVLTVNGVVNQAHTVCRPWLFRRTREGEMERHEVTLPERVAKLYLDMRGEWGLRPLDGIASAPLLHADGGIRVAEGYDTETRLWCERVPEIDVPATPTKDEAAIALTAIRHHFRTFAFADAIRVLEDGQPGPVVDLRMSAQADESTFLAALMTAVCRPSLWLAPGMLVRAPQFSGAGTGKGLLVRAVCAVAFGTRPSAMTGGGTPEELDKRITAALMEAGSVVFLDNMNATALKSDVLASAITERPAYVRPLGSSKTVPLNPSAFVAVTGNGLTLSEDMARRFLTIELDAGVEDPEARSFQGDFLAETLNSRGEILRHILTIWRWGRQQGATLKQGRAMGSFADWGTWCRDPLLSLGCKDPALRVDDAKEKDPRRQYIAEVFQAWWEAHDAMPVAVAGLRDSVRAVADPEGRGRQYLAARIRALEGTRAAGFVLVRSPSVGKWNPDLYALKKTETA